MNKGMQRKSEWKRFRLDPPATVVNADGTRRDLDIVWLETCKDATGRDLSAVGEAYIIRINFDQVRETLSNPTPGAETGQDAEAILLLKVQVKFIPTGSGVQFRPLPRTPAQPAASVESARLVRRLAPVLDDLGKHAGGLGHVMSMSLGLQGWEDRYAAMELLFGEYDQILPDLHVLADQGLAQSIRKAVLGVRTDYLPQAKREIERGLRELESRGGIDWLARRRSIPGELLETQGKSLCAMAARLRNNDPGRVGGEK